MVATRTAAGAEFYNERLGRAAALPESQRSSDVAAWLHSHAVVQAAAAAMPELPDNLERLVEPLGGKPALAAVLQYLAYSYCHTPADPHFPCGVMRQLAPQLPPLVHVVTLAGRRLDLQPHTLGVLASGGMPSNAANLETTARMLLLSTLSSDSYSEKLAAMQAMEPWLFDRAGAARLSQQLQQLHQEVCTGSGAAGSSNNGGGSSDSGGRSGSSGSSGSSSAEPLPTVEQLQVVWHMLAVELAMDVPAGQELPPATIAALLRKAVSGLQRLQPGNLRTSFWLGEAALNCQYLQPTSVPFDPLPHFLRCAQLAREQRSDYWLARSGWTAAFATAIGSAALGPAQTFDLLAEADAAYKRCKAVVPPAWAQTLRNERKLCASARPTIAAHMQQSPQQWRPDIMRTHQEGRLQTVSSAVSEVSAGLQIDCAACGRHTVGLRKCSACKGPAYCSTACQKQHWPVHKAACKAAREAAGRSAGASSS